MRFSQSVLALALTAVALWPAPIRAQAPGAAAATSPVLTQGSGAAVSDRTLPLRRRRRIEASEGLRIENVNSVAVAKQNERFEIGFDLVGGTATVPLWPFDPQSPAGVSGEEGVTAYATFRHESGAEWRQPAFLYQSFQHEVRQSKDWIYPEAQERWTVRFSPHLPGRWSYTLSAIERSGSAESAPRAFSVQSSATKGFIRVSQADPRYFEYSDGSPFYPIGIQSPEFLNGPRTQAAPFYAQLAGSGVTLVRMWLGSLFGSAWMPYIGGRDQYRGYLPNAGLVTVTAAPDPDPQFAMLLDWHPNGDTGWFDACRLLGRDSVDAVKAGSYYLVSAEYAAWNVSGPRDMRSPEFGFVIKRGEPRNDCYQAGSGTPITTYGGAADSGVWRTISGVLASGQANFLPPLQIALENASSGTVFVRSISVRELHADGSLGPEILSRPRMDYSSYVGQKLAYQFDQILEDAEAAAVHLKLVLLEKGDELWLKIADDGSFTDGGDNIEGFYGVGRAVNKTRWLQRAWWRYAQARWGYSPAIHSWELLNEGDPELPRHLQMADEFARYMKYGVFGLPVPENGAVGELHPNAHLVTTSFWHSFPCDSVWRNPEYRFLDYADLHAYVSTSPASLAEREAMQFDAAYYHQWHSALTSTCTAGKPVMRGEAGMDTARLQSPTALGIDRDADKLWLHNFVWSTVDSGPLSEVYWWSQHLLKGSSLQLQPYRILDRFLADVDLNRGGYSDWRGTTDAQSLRVTGQKNTASGRMHLWIQNRASTWARTVTPSAVSGTIRAQGFRPSSTFRVEYWDTRTGATSDRTAQSDAAGALSIPVADLTTDVAVKVYPQTKN